MRRCAPSDWGCKGVANFLGDVMKRFSEPSSSPNSPSSPLSTLSPSSSLSPSST